MPTFAILRCYAPEYPDYEFRYVLTTNKPEVTVSGMLGPVEAFRELLGHVESSGA